MLFARNPRTRWHTTRSGHILYACHNGEYLFVGANDMTHPLVVIRRNGKKWYVRLTDNFGFVPRTVTTTTITKRSVCDVDIDDPTPKTREKSVTTFTTSFTYAGMDAAVRAATVLCLEHFRRTRK